MRVNDKVLRNILIKLNLNSSTKAYKYILECVNYIAVKNYHVSITELYDHVSRIYDSNYSAIDRSIRYGIMKAYQTHLLDNIYINRPTTTSFIYDLAFNLDIMKEAVLNEN